MNKIIHPNPSTLYPIEGVTRTVYFESLSEFTASSLFSDSEKAALKWAESLTKLDGNKKVHNTELSKHFSEREVVDITLCISLMNTFNRLAISMRDE